MTQHCRRGSACGIWAQPQAMIHSCRWTLVVDCAAADQARRAAQASGHSCGAHLQPGWLLGSRRATVTRPFLRGGPAPHSLDKYPPLDPPQTPERLGVGASARDPASRPPGGADRESAWTPPPRKRRRGWTRTPEGLHQVLASGLEANSRHTPHPCVSPTAPRGGITAADPRVGPSAGGGRQLAAPLRIPQFAVPVGVRDTTRRGRQTAVARVGM